MLWRRGHTYAVIAVASSRIPCAPRLVPPMHRIDGAMSEGRHFNDWRCAAALIVALGLSGCSQSVTPAAMLDMRGLPDDAQRRNERLDKAAARPAAENSRPLPPKARQAETVAATAAAIIGSIFSSSPSVLLGAGTSFEETPMFDPQASSANRRKESADEADVEPIDASQLVPWVKLRPDDPK